MKKRVSIADVAALADVSIATVSRVINDTGYPVSSNVRDRVLAAVERLRYTPSSAAQRLRSDFNKVIGLIVRDISNGFFGEIAKGATERAIELGYLCFVCNTGRDAANEMGIHELLWKNRVRGIVLAGGGINTPEYQSLLLKQVERSNRFGLRLIANSPQGVEMPLISYDVEAVSSMITNYFLERGHRIIGLITGEQGVMTSQHHRSGFLNAMSAKSVPIHPALIKLEAFSEENGYLSCLQMLAHSPRPTAICCGCDPIAVGVLHALKDAGLEVPKDVSLISIGDTPIAAHLSPAITSIRTPRYAMGARAVELLVGQEKLKEDFKEYLPVELIERESVRHLG
jgi:LacI family transcriptional regulator